METQAALQPVVYEQTLMSIVRTLPTERVVQVVDFARFMQSQVLSHDVLISKEETEANDTLPSEEEIRADNERWDATFAASRDTLRMLANQAREEIRAGRSRPMIFTDDGRIASSAMPTHAPQRRNAAMPPMTSPTPRRCPR